MDVIDSAIVRVRRPGFDCCRCAVEDVRDSYIGKVRYILPFVRPEGTNRPIFPSVIVSGGLTTCHAFAQAQESSFAGVACKLLILLREEGSRHEKKGTSFMSRVCQIKSPCRHRALHLLWREPKLSRWRPRVNEYASRTRALRLVASSPTTISAFNTSRRYPASRPCLLALPRSRRALSPQRRAFSRLHMPVIDTTGPAIWVTDLRSRAELEQSFVAIEHEVLVASVQLVFERTLTG